MHNLSILPVASSAAFAASLTALLVVAGPAVCQQTFHVSPGGTYPTVQAAINAASHGDIVRIAAGSYPEFTCAKALRIEGGPGVAVACSLTLTGGIALTGIPAGMQCVLSGITMTRSGLCVVDPSLSITNSAGSVIVDRVSANSGGTGCRLIVENVAGGVLVSDSRFVNSRILGTTVHLTGLDFQASPCGNAQEVLGLVDAVVTMVDGRLDSGHLTTGVGVRLLNSRMTLGVAQGLSIWNVPPLGGAWTFVIGANSQVVQHSRVTPSNPWVTGGPWLLNDEPVALRVFTAPPGGVVAMGLYVYGPAVPAVVFYGTQAAPSTLPFIDGPLALGSTGLLVGLPALVTPAWSTTPAALAFGVPFDAALQGLPLVAQGFVYGGSVAPFRATNAVGFTLR